MAKEKKKQKKDVLVKANKKGRHPIGLLSFLRTCVLPLVRLVRPFRIYGKYEPASGACIFVVNHYTLLDVAYVVGSTKDGVRLVAKKEVEDMFFVGGLARGIKCIFVNRDGNDVRALLDCFKVLKNGEKLCIFPEGTRNKTDEEMLPFKHGASAMAIKTKTPVIPIVIYKKPKFFRRAHILMGEPIEFSEYYDKKNTEEDFSKADMQLREIMLNMKAEHTRYLEEKKAKKKAKKQKKNEKE